MMSLRQFYGGRVQRDASEDFDSAAVPFPHGYNPPVDLLLSSPTPSEEDLLRAYIHV